jgi:hypothetical protein
VKGGTPIYVKGFVEDNHVSMPEVESNAQAAERVRQQIHDGADGIKIFAGSVERDSILILPLDLAKAIVVEPTMRGSLFLPILPTRREWKWPFRTEWTF